MRFIFAPIVFILGILLMKYNVQVTNLTGKIEFAEKYFNAGMGAGTYTWWRLCGLGICIIATLWFFNKLPHSSTPATTEQPVSISIPFISFKTFI